MTDRESIAQYLESQADARRVKAMNPAERNGERLKIEALILDAMASDVRAELDVRTTTKEAI